ncbi:MULTISPECIES: sigma-E factor negative regulatory protein [Luteimonas]|uniref:sigma-E factor negative regulatory protein n=1 Tax=Luteimonas TaxID=83614 RepID=UPI000C7A503A|nr:MULTISPECIES: sigma-E factor negative regulatory protein [Luteimonas]
MSPADDIDALQLGPDPDKLERYNRQQLSAMLDGELSQDQARFMRRRLQHDAELGGCFERWQVCGDVLRGRQVSLLPTDFADRVARGIAAGDSVATVTADVARRPRLLRWGGGAALAASVALVALFVGRPSTPDARDGDAPQPLVADVGAVAPAVAPVGSDVLADAGAITQSAPLADAAARLAAGAAVAVADVPRRNNGDRRNVRGQSQRAALRVQQAQQGVGARAVAAAAPPRPQSASASADTTRLASAASFAAADSALVLPASDAVARPWPKAMMSGLSGDAGFSVRYDTAFPAPSWAGAEPVGSNPLPRFPVQADDAAPQRPDRAMP